MSHEASRKSNLYVAIIERLFFGKYASGVETIEFERHEIDHAAAALGLTTAKNLGDIVYSFKYRRDLPQRIRETAPHGREWRLTTAGRSRYRFILASAFRLVPDSSLVEIKVLEATPGIIARYALSDEQALLAKLRYNRLIDTFTGVTCYSLQNHLRTSVQVETEDARIETMQIETDEIYVGVDRRGVHYVFPVQAKGGSDRIAVQQIEQDVLLCHQKFSDLLCVPIAAQFMGSDGIALFSFESTGNSVRKVMERHYRLVGKEEFDSADLRAYRKRLDVD